VTQSKRLRFRTYVDGKLVFEKWATSLEEMPDAALAVAPALAAPDRPFYLEVFDPDRPRGQKTIRMGNDPRLGTDIPITTDNLQAQLEEHHPWWVDGE
jgi:hypothetical protein